MEKHCVQRRRWELYMIRLEKVNEQTFKKLVDMKLPEDQNIFVAPNVVSLAQAWLYYESARPMAICYDEEVVGFIMLDWDEAERTVGIWRFMIAPDYQKRGYGRKALEIAIELIRKEDKFDLIYLDYVQGNTVAHDLFYSLGFRENGDVEDGEIVMILPLTNEPKVGMLIADKDDIEDFLEIVHSEKEAGADIPEELQNETKIRESVAKCRLWRFTIMGKTIGFAIGDKLLVESKSSIYLEEVKTKYTGLAQYSTASW